MPITIGRNPKSTICVSEDYDIVSNDHAEIIQQGSEIIFTDHSSNGTIINGQKIQGKSVNIYRGDKIVLAGVYELPWEKIEAMITPVGRPTVARNIRGDMQEVPGNQQWNAGYSRPTEVFDHSQQYRQAEERVQFVQQERRQTSSFVERRSTSVQTERELSKWNWGAFYFGWLWGVFNKVYLSLVQLVVSVITIALSALGMGIVVPFMSAICLGISVWLGVKGSQMAWENGAYRNLEHFRQSRHNWAIAAAIVFGVTIFLIVISLLLFIDILAKLF